MAIPSERRSAAVAESSLQLVQVLTSVLAAGWIDGTVLVERSHPVQGQLGYACIRLLRDPQGEFGCRPRCDGMDDRAGRIVEPVTLGFGVRRDPRLATIDLVGEDEHPAVPVRHVTEHARDRPVFVGRRCEGIVVHPVDELPETLALAVVDLDVRAIVRHHCVLPAVEALNRNPQHRHFSLTCTTFGSYPFLSHQMDDRLFPSHSRSITFDPPLPLYLRHGKGRSRPRAPGARQSGRCGPRPHPARPEQLSSRSTDYGSETYTASEDTLCGAQGRPTLRV